MSGHEELTKIAKEAVSKIQGDRVLDVGTGFGVVVNQVLTTTGCSLVSIDPEAWSFKELENEYETEISTGRLKLLRESIEELPFASGDFDSTISISSIHHLDDPVKGVRNMEKVSGKRILVADWNGQSAGVTNPHKKEQLEASKKILFDYFRNNDYHTIEDKYWFLGWNDL